MLNKSCFFLIFCICLFNFQPLSAQSNYTTTDFFVPNGDLQLQVRKVTEGTYSSRRKIPILLIHGGTGAITSFDLGVDDASFAKSLADAGFAVYLMNIRGWERSTAPAYNAADTALVAASCEEAAADIDAVVNYLIKDIPKRKIDLLGWAAGGHWASYYTTLHNDKVAHLIALNSLYGVKAPWALNESFADPGDSTKFNTSIPTYRQSNEQQMTTAWKTGLTDSTISADSAVMVAFAKTAVSFNAESLLKTPGGYRKESFYMAGGRKYWDAKDITVPTLLIRSENDFWSRPVDLDTYYNELVNAPAKKKVTLAGAGHFVIMDRYGKGHRNLIIAINNFVKKGL